MARVAFDRFTFDTETGDLTSGGAAVALEPQPARLLALLLGNAGHTLTRDEIAAALWPDVHVATGPAMHYAVRHLRRALGDSASAPRFIATDGRRGYRFVATVHPTAPARAGAATWPFALGATAALIAAVVIAETTPNRHHELAVTIVSAIHAWLF